MPTAHSRVTAHDRLLLAQTWGSRTARLNRDSFLPFGACRLCLLTARDPVACSYGAHLFCRGCAIDNLLAQKTEIKRLERLAETERAEDADGLAADDARRQEIDIAAFEATLAGFDAAGQTRRGHLITTRQGEEVHVDEKFIHRGVKRKFELEKEAVAGSDNTSRTSEPETSFWIPTKTPDGQLVRTGIRKAEPVCPAATMADGEEDEHAAHEFSLKTLVNVQFSRSEDSKAADDTDDKEMVCPACSKTLSNSTKAILARPCGHVLCKSCAERFLIPSERDIHAKDEDPQEVGVVRCYVCQEDVTERGQSRAELNADEVGKKSKKDKKKKGKIAPGIVEIQSEGTGFAGGGNNVVKRSGIAFQC